MKGEVTLNDLELPLPPGTLNKHNNFVNRENQQMQPDAESFRQTPSATQLTPASYKKNLSIVGTMSHW